jgi:hypothetical protein
MLTNQENTVLMALVGQKPMTILEMRKQNIPADRTILRSLERKGKVVKEEKYLNNHSTIGENKKLVKVKGTRYYTYKLA